MNIKNVEYSDSSQNRTLSWVSFSPQKSVPPMPITPKKEKPENTNEQKSEKK